MKNPDRIDLAHTTCIECVALAMFLREVYMATRIFGDAGRASMRSLAAKN